MAEIYEDEGDRPLRQSSSGMSPNRWHTLLDRWLAGEPIQALAAEYGVERGTIHYNANKYHKRKKDHADAVRLPKGPVPVTAQEQLDGRVRLVCRDLSLTVDRRDPSAVREAALDAVSLTMLEGLWAQGRGVLSLTRGALELLDPRWRKTRLRWIPPEPEPEPEPEPAFERGEAGPEDPVRAPLVLRRAQTPPVALPGGRDWATWLFLGGRGAGKTLAGASWLADQATAAGTEAGAGGRLALIGPTLHDVREVMVEGVSGIRALPRWSRADRPRFEPSRRRLVFDSGAVAQVFSAEDPDSLRGPQFSAAWADEFCAWPAVGARGAGETLALLRMGLRLGTTPRLVVTTTPRPTRALLALRDERRCVVTHAGTADNAQHLSPGFLEDLRELYGGTRRAAQELEGQIVEIEGALFTAVMMAAARGDAGEGPLDRIVVAIDPTTTAGGDACGIVAAGSRRRADGRREAVVLADRSAAGLSPDGWARRAVALTQEVGAVAIVAEVNQGGEMVRQVLRAAGCSLMVREVRATRGKRIRAEPVAALYEQGRVRHAGAFSALEEELMALGWEGEAAGSLDRADALVWAITDLLIDRPDGDQGPRARWL